MLTIIIRKNKSVRRIQVYENSLFCSFNLFSFFIKIFVKKKFEKQTPSLSLIQYTHISYFSHSHFIFNAASSNITNTFSILIIQNKRVRAQNRCYFKRSIGKEINSNNHKNQNNRQKKIENSIQNNYNKMI